MLSEPRSTLRRRTWVVSNSSTITAISLNIEAGGELRIAAEQHVWVSENSAIRTRARGSQTGGNLVIDADEIRVFSGGEIETQADRSGRGGDVRLTADSVAIDDGSLRSTAASDGPGGALIVRAGDMRVDDGQVTTLSGVRGPAGSIDIEADEIVLTGGQTNISTTNRSSVVTPDPGGNIRLSSGSTSIGFIHVVEGAQVTAETTGVDGGGSIKIETRDLVVAGGGTSGGGEPRAATVQARTQAEGRSGTISIEVDTIRVGKTATSDLPGLITAFVAPGATGDGGIRDAAGVLRGIDIEAGSALLEDGGQISTTALGDGPAGAIDIQASQSVTARGGATIDDTPIPSGIFSRGEGSQDGGDVTIAAPTIVVQDGAEISTRSLGTGRSGNVTLEASDLVRVEGAASQRSIVTSRTRDGNGGNVTIETSRLEVLNGGAVDVSTNGDGPGGRLIVTAESVLVAGTDANGFEASLAAEALGFGDAQGITIHASESVEIGVGGQITVVSLAPGGAGGEAGGTAGDITVVAESIVVRGGVTAESRQAQGGSIDLTASDTLEIDGGLVTARSRDSGDAGTIRLEADRFVTTGGSVTADAENFGGDIEITGHDLVQLNASDVVALTRGNDPSSSGGNITISGGEVNLDQSLVNAEALGGGAGGSVDLASSGSITLDRSEVTARSTVGDGGGIAAKANHLTLKNSSINAEATEGGVGGSIDLNASGSITLDRSEVTARSIGGDGGGIAARANHLNLLRSSISAEASEGGVGGSIDLYASGSVNFNQSEVTARSIGGDAGNIALTAPVITSTASTITAEADGFGGNISVNASELVYLNANSQIVALSRGITGPQSLALDPDQTSGAGGNIDIIGGAVVLNGSFVNANGFGNADGGNISISAAPLLVSGDSAITASSQLGTAGSVIVNAPNSEITGELTSLPSNFLDASALLEEACLAREEVSGTFTIRSSGQLPPAPDALLEPDAGARGQQCGP